ncbi:MAG: GDSL-type esterase/lipase family protein, partial [Gammaproteobacteria bacterium]|nr:GDSL-type esterase/lipase family protein [Gammaproteobacteria bacterium]
MTLKSFLLACGLILSCAAHAAADKSILVLGDSLSAAYGIEQSAGWVSLLERRLQQQGYRYRVVNASISGETTSGALTRLPRPLDTHR